MKERCIVIPAIKKNAVIPDQLVKKLAGVTLVQRAINTARGVLPSEDIVVLTDSQEISLICERAGVGFRRNKDLRFTSLDIVSEMRVLLEYLLPLCRVGGQALAQKGGKAAEETAVAAEAITILGGGVPQTAEWGRMLTYAQAELSIAPQLAFLPGLCIAVTALGFTLLGESLRESLDPKSRTA